MHAVGTSAQRDHRAAVLNLAVRSAQEERREARAVVGTEDRLAGRVEVDRIEALAVDDVLRDDRVVERHPLFERPLPLARRHLGTDVEGPCAPRLIASVEASELGDPVGAVMHEFIDIVPETEHPRLREASVEERDRAGAPGLHPRPHRRQSGRRHEGLGLEVEPRRVQDLDHRAVLELSERLDDARAEVVEIAEAEHCSGELVEFVRRVDSLHERQEAEPLEPGEHVRVPARDRDALRRQPPTSDPCDLVERPIEDDPRVDAPLAELNTQNRLIEHVLGPLVGREDGVGPAIQVTHEGVDHVRREAVADLHRVRHAVPTRARLELGDDRPQAVLILDDDHIRADDPHPLRRVRAGDARDPRRDLVAQECIERRILPSEHLNSVTEGEDRSADPHEQILEVRRQPEGPGERPPGDSEEPLVADPGRVHRLDVDIDRTRHDRRSPRRRVAVDELDRNGDQVVQREVPSTDLREVGVDDRRLGNRGLAARRPATLVTTRNFPVRHHRLPGEPDLSELDREKIEEVPVVRNEGQLGRRPALLEVLIAQDVVGALAETLAETHDERFTSISDLLLGPPSHLALARQPGLDEPVLLAQLPEPPLRFRLRPFQTHTHFRKPSCVVIRPSSRLR